MNSEPAFPTSVHPNSRDGRDMSGMSLRDWFAGQALTGIHASRETFLAILADRGRQDPLQAVARAAYSMADEMLAARAEGKAS